MISIKTGNVGSGKTLSVIKIISERLLKGLDIVSDVNFYYDVFVQDNPKCDKIGRFFYEPNVNVDYLLLHAYKYHDLCPDAVENQTLVILDECRERFDARTWNTDKTRSDWRLLFEQHRKFKYNFILICQDYMDLDPKIHEKAEYVEFHKKLNNSAIFGFFFNMIRVDAFICVIKWKTKTMNVVRKEYFRFKKAYGKYYNTAQLSSSLEARYNELVKRYEQERDRREGTSNLVHIESKVV